MRFLLLPLLLLGLLPCAQSFWPFSSASSSSSSQHHAQPPAPASRQLQNTGELQSSCSNPSGVSFSTAGVPSSFTSVVLMAGQSYSRALSTCMSYSTYR